jgi:hypothetical protein
VANKWREARFMVFTIEPRFMPSLKRSLQRKIKEVMMRATLDVDTTDNLPLGCTWLILQEEVVLEEWEVGVDGEIALVEVNKYGDLNNGIRVEMN